LAATTAQRKKDAWDKRGASDVVAQGQGQGAGAGQASGAGGGGGRFKKFANALSGLRGGGGGQGKAARAAAAAAAERKGLLRSGRDDAQVLLSPQLLWAFDAESMSASGTDPDLDLDPDGGVPAGADQGVLELCFPHNVAVQRVGVGAGAAGGAAGGKQQRKRQSLGRSHSWVNERLLGALHGRRHQAANSFVLQLSGEAGAEAEADGGGGQGGQGGQGAAAAPLYGVCVRVYRLYEEPAAKQGGKTRHAVAPHVYCLLTRLPFFEFYFNVLWVALSAERAAGMHRGLALKAGGPGGSGSAAPGFEWQRQRQRSRRETRRQRRRRRERRRQRRAGDGSGDSEVSEDSEDLSNSNSSGSGSEGDLYGDSSDSEDSEDSEEGGEGGQGGQHHRRSSLPPPSPFASSVPALSLLCKRLSRVSVPGPGKFLRFHPLLDEATGDETLPVVEYRRPAAPLTGMQLPRLYSVYGSDSDDNSGGGEGGGGGGALDRQLRRQQRRVDALIAQYGADEEAVALQGWALPVLLSAFSPDCVQLLLGCLLTEMQVVIVGDGDSLGTVTACVLGLLALLRPLTWTGPVISVMPDKLEDLLQVQKATRAARTRSPHLPRPPVTAVAPSLPPH
jgi:hypothetical protein